MTFLIMQMFVYLLLAGLIGGGAGWLVRNLQAQKSDEAASRAVHDAKSKLPQLESLLRSRDDRNNKMKAELDDTKTQLKQREQARRELEHQLNESVREKKRLNAQLEAKSFAAAEDNLEMDSTGHDEEVTLLTQEIESLKQALASAESNAAEAQQQAQAQAHAQDAGETGLGEIEREALQAQLVSADRKYTAAAKELKMEQDKVVELERERELQNKSLQVLHQQLEMERSRRRVQA